MHIHDSEVNLEFEHDEMGWDCRAIWRGFCIGSFSGVPQGSAALLLCDVKVEDEVPIADTLPRKIMSILGCKFAGTSFRNKGVGTFLMRGNISEARKCGFASIYGSIVDHDLTRTPFLLDWYKALGFSVTDSDESCLPNAVRRISISL